MNFLSIDCSTDKGSLFLKFKNKTFNRVLQSDKSHNDLLMKEILDFFFENNLKFNDISHIFVNQGPGNFSGLRGSLSVAKGISLAKNLNLSGYNTFLWACSKFYNSSDILYSIIKFREEYFIKKFDKKLKAISKIEKIAENEIIKKYCKELKIIPKNIVENFNDKILKLSNVKIVDLDHNDLEFMKLHDLLDENLIKPLYLG
tara:strand:- start:81 stop:686 length:606 start_codon:yes stop_codon:yes gene_type:complete